MEQIHANKAIFNQKCRLCPRLAVFLDDVREEHPDYHALPVAPFGEADPQLLIVGLAPGMHGANATGRPFTGDHAGILLYETLYEFGFSNQSTALSIDDGLILHNCRITNAVKCLPPKNKPVGAEINTCNQYLKAEIASLRKNAVILTLGLVAHQAVVKALGLRIKDHKFVHGQVHYTESGYCILNSYHCSRYNTQTRRLTTNMFKDVFRKAKQLMNQ